MLDQQQREEINALRQETHTTMRATVPALEDVMYEPIPVLDHGFVRVVDYMGDDAAIVQSARVSYGKGTKKVNQDAGLINYLIRHRHTTPFEMCEIKFHIKLPFFVARQWIRHRTANVNEYSARYSILDKEFYVPAKEHLAPQSKSNHQGRSDQSLSETEAARVLEILKDDSIRSYRHYEEMLNLDPEGNVLDQDKQGLARELARMNLPLNFYTQWYWKIDLHNLMHFLALRADSHAQYEIRVYAEAMLSLVEKWVPITYAAMQNYVVRGQHLSGSAMDMIKKLVRGEKVDFSTSGMGKREWHELLETLELDPTLETVG
ncbi:MAG: FAD-dependent thymidylate synthase [Alphaproteobacteria bacterium]|nr:FAD-dependent thymidylate synthase [Alphaproteobacteria bacterium]